MNKIILSAILALICTMGNAQNNRTNYEFQKDQIGLFSSWWNNPAMRFHYPLEELTEVSLSQSAYDNNVYNVQKGDKGNNFEFLANSFTKKQNKLFYGGASYNNGVQKNVNWNTLTDIDRLYPYIVADTIPDKMRKEQYYFSGGYAQKMNESVLGIFASYTASTSYDRRDPRPYNKVFDLQLATGISRKLLPDYNFGLNVFFDRYQQDQKLSLFKDNGSASVFYLRGLGVADATYSTVITKTNGGADNTYKQNCYGVNLSMLPLNKKRLFVSLSASINNLELTSGNNQTVSEYDKKLGKLEFAYKISKGYNIKLLGELSKGDGTEFNYDISKKYLLNKAKKFTNITQFLQLAFAGEMNLGSKTKANFILSSDYHSLEEKYLKIGNASINNKNIKNLSIGFLANVLRQYEQSSLLFKLETNYRNNLSKELNAGRLAADKAIEQLVMPNYTFQSSNRLFTNLLIRYDYFINEKYALYLKGNFAYSKFNQIDTGENDNRAYSIAIGLSF
ncbi:DUF6850 family outer membrane beta-barrel protein [Marinifilum breve]|nr:DUF6850 family outer membrane beta-barrel protein [Marinifilum breve]